MIPWYFVAFFISSLKTNFLPIPKKKLEVSHPEIQYRGDILLKMEGLVANKVRDVI